MLKILNSIGCVGCTACANICPKHCLQMKPDRYGFSYPVLVDAAICIECGACERACPVSNKTLEPYTLPIAFAAFSKDETIRMESSSGGVFTELAKEILDNGGVVYGASYNSDFCVEHICVDSIERLHKLRGSKYSESNLNTVFKEILMKLKNGQLVLFSGTPCQIAGLKSFLGKDYDNLYCIDFVCHGIPSPMVWASYIKYRAENDSNGQLPVGINLRSKETGWSRYNYSNCFKYRDYPDSLIFSKDSLFMKLFTGGYIMRKSCENCNFKGYSRASDITIGDFWGIWNIAPEMDDDKGTSLALVQSSKGRDLWNRIQNQIISKEVSLENASEENNSILCSMKPSPIREETLETIKNGDISKTNLLFVPKRVSFVTRVKRRLKKILFGY